MNILTFDIEDWFHLLDNDSTRHQSQWDGFEARICGNTDRILDLLNRKGLKATFFCLGWVARKYPDLVRRIDGMGHEIGSHSFHHQLVYEQGRDGFRRDLGESIKVIQDVTGKPVRSYRAPGFSVRKDSLWALEALLESGIELDCSIFTPRRAHGGVSMFPLQEPFLVEREGLRLKEFPMTYFRLGALKIVFSGGGYFRMMPYPLVRGMARRSDYVMTYFHPRDFDPGQPVLPGLSTARRWKSYFGLGTAFGKLERLLDDFTWISLEEADARVDWGRARVIRLEPQASATAA